jgi:hypothetical protein
MIRRVGLGTISVLLIAAVCWNVSDGVIYLHGSGIARADHPILFWFTAVAAISFALVILHWSVFRAGKGKPTL